MTTTATRRRRIRSPLDSYRNAVFLLAPTVALIFLYKYVPIGQAIWASLNAFSVAGNPLAFVGLDNFVHVLTDVSFLHSLALTVIFAAVKIPLQLALGLGAALLLYQSSAFNSVLRVVIVIPAITPIAIIGIIFLFLFDREVGLTNAFLTAFGVGRVSWLTTPATAQAVVAVASIWRDAGFTMLIYLAGLTAIPTQVREAARIDGANGWQSTTRIILPMLQRSTQLATVTTTIAAFQFFAPIFVLTRGGPQDATDVAAYHIYEQAFVFYDQGTANAMSVILVSLIVVITTVELYVLRSRWEY